MMLAQAEPDMGVGVGDGNDIGDGAVVIGVSC